MVRSPAPGTQIVVPPGLSLEYARVGRPEEEPPETPGTVDLAVLDMHHGYPNLGHASIVESLLNYAHDERVRRGGKAPAVRILSYDVRAGHAIPSAVARFPLVVGSGGPGAIDPRENDGVYPAAQGVREDPRWEAPLFRYFDAVMRTESVALLAICHSFGVVSRWAGAARAELRPESKGGKSAGIVTNVLADEIRAHPYFAGYLAENGGPEVKVLDSRLYDLLPTGNGARALAFEALPGGGSRRGEAVTMLEFARAGSGVPRLWGVNHHPEIGDVALQRERLHRIRENGGVTEAWFRERLSALDARSESPAAEKALQTTSAWTFERPLRFHIARILDERS